MTTRNAFFDSVGGDRVYTSDTFANIFKAANTDGIIPLQGNELAVIASVPAALTVEVRTGAAWVQGRYFEVYSVNEVLSIAAGHPVYGRTDRVVIRLDYVNRTMGLAVLTGTPAASPAAPALTQNSSIWEYSLAQIGVAANATTITNSVIAKTSSDGYYSTGRGLTAISSVGVLTSPVDMQQVYIKQLRTTFVYDSSAGGWSQLTVPAYSGSFPSTLYAPIGFRVWRSDRNLEYYWDGTRWLSTELFYAELMENSAASMPYAQGTHFFDAKIKGQTINGVYIETLSMDFRPVSTAQSSSNYYTAGFLATDGTGTTTIPLTGTTDTRTFAQAHNDWNPTVTKTALGTGYFLAELTISVGAGNPGTFRFFGSVGYRLIG